MSVPPPAGVWAVADALTGADHARRWAEIAAPAAAFTFRRPRGSERAALAALRVLRARTRFLAVHGRGDWAAAAEADAVIATFDSLPSALLRAHWPRLQVGASTHELAEVAAAAAAGAGFVLFGPVYATPSKAGLLAPRGLAALAEAGRRGLPVIAIGGITTRAQVQEARAAGAHAVAVLRAAQAAAFWRSLADQSSANRGV